MSDDSRVENPRLQGKSVKSKSPISLKARALKYLSLREHSRQELARKLARHAEAPDEVEAVLDFLVKHNFLSQSRFAESLVNRRAARFGNSRIVAELQSHGLPGADIDAAKTELLADEESRARQVWQRKFGQPPADAAERAKQMRFLQQRGFSSRAIRAAMNGADPDDDQA